MVIRPEDLEMTEVPEDAGEGSEAWEKAVRKITKFNPGYLTGTVSHLIFKGVHYEMEVQGGGFEWLVHSTKMFPVGTKVLMSVDPFNIQIMNKPASEDEEAVGVEDI